MVVSPKTETTKNEKQISDLNSLQKKKKVYLKIEFYL